MPYRDDLEHSIKPVGWLIWFRTAKSMKINTDPSTQEGLCKSNIFWSNSTLIAFSVILEAVFWPQRIIKIQMVLRSPNTHAAFVHTHSVRTYFSPKPTDSKKLNTYTLLELISTHEWSDLHKRHNNVYLLLEKPLCFTQRESLYVGNSPHAF